MPKPGETAAAVRAMTEAEEAAAAAARRDPPRPPTVPRAAEGEAAAPVSIDPPLAG